MKIGCTIKRASITALFFGEMFLAANAAPPPGDWALVWSDEFSGTNLDTTRWGYGSTPWGTESHSSCTLIPPEDTYVGGGYLTNRSRLGPFTGSSGATYDYSSGWTWSKTWLKYGYLEIRAMYPTNRGAWPAFWMLKSGWPPEFDIAEYRGSPKSYMTQAFYWGQWSTTLQYGDFSDWHSYGLEWGPGYLKWYIDDQVTKTFSGDEVPADPMYVILSAGTSCSDADGTGFPNYYVIDYFRWYQKTFPGAPEPPGGLTASLTAAGIYLDWTSPPDWDVNHYNVYSSTASGGPYSLLTSNVTATAYTATGLTNGTTYHYVVTAVDDDGNESLPGNEASGTAITFYPVTVDNNGFEEPGAGKIKGWNGENGTDIPGWWSDSPAADSGVEPASTTQGSYRGFLMGSDPPVWQMTSESISAGKIYLLEVDLWATSGATTAALSLFYVDDADQRVELDRAEYNVSGLGNTSAVNGTVLYGVNDGPAAAVGRNLGIMIDNTAGGWSGMDRVRLSYGSAAPPGAGLTSSVSGNTLSLSWPAGQGWRLQIQSNSLDAGLGSNWQYLTDGAVSSTNIAINPGMPVVFFRLAYP